MTALAYFLGGLAAVVMGVVLTNGKPFPPQTMLIPRPPQAVMFLLLGAVVWAHGMEMAGWVPYGVGLFLALAAMVVATEAAIRVRNFRLIRAGVARPVDRRGRPL